MIEVNSLAAVFMLEGLAGAFLFLLGIAIFFLRRRTKERNAADEFINRIKKSEAKRAEELGKAIAEACEMEKAQLESVLSEFRSCEKSLYQKILQMFLSRDAVLLNGIDQNVEALAKPFCRILSEAKFKSNIDPELGDAIEAARREIEQLKRDKEQLSKQLSMAMDTMDEISSEYTKIFGTSSDADELDLSRKRMLNTYLRAEQRFSKAFNET